MCSIFPCRPDVLKNGLEEGQKNKFIMLQYQVCSSVGTFVSFGCGLGIIMDIMMIPSGSF